MIFLPPSNRLSIWVLCFFLAAPVLAVEDNPQDSPTAEPGTSQNQPPAPPVPLVGDPEYSWFHRVLAQNLTSNLFTRQNLVPFIVGAGSALAISPADQEISNTLRDEIPGFGDVGQNFGGIATASFVGGTVLVSRLTKSDRFRTFSYTLAQAYTTNYILTQGLKYATHRMRPDGSSSTSFPSGHASQIFTIATVVSHYYGKNWGVPLYALSVLVGVSRIEQGRHWPSDAVAGAALGYIASQTAIRGTKRELAGKKPLSGLIILPLYERDCRGISVRFSY